jgi:hypothetical protein
MAGAAITYAERSMSLYVAGMNALDQRYADEQLRAERNAPPPKLSPRSGSARESRAAWLEREAAAMRERMRLRKGGRKR